MDADITVECLPILGVCNLCLGEGAVKSMMSHNYFNGTDDLYTDILMKCFAIDILNMELGDTKRVICENCIMKLHDTLKFKEQAEKSLRALETTARLHVVKKEMDYHDCDDDFDYEDNKVIADIIVKKEMKEESEMSLLNGRKTKRRVKAKLKPLKRKKCTQTGDTCSSTVNCMEFLKRGLFPFKMQKNAYVCFICPEKTTSLEDMRSHFSEHREKYILLAYKKTGLASSAKFFLSNRVFCCKSCLAEVSNFDQMKSHLDSCSRTERRWRESLPFKLEKDQLDCHVCKKTFLNFVSLNTHMNVHYPNYICENCGKAFASKARLRAHMRTHEIGEFPCNLCGMVFDKVTKKENHVSKEHKAGVRYVCKRCNIPLSSFYARQKHLADVHDEELKRYKCKACPQSYVTPGHLSSHVRRDHLNERNYKCDKCDLAFYTRNALKMHMIKHDGERIHTCHICQKAYQRKKTLREHMRIHNNDKRFVCPVCGRAFTQKCTLKGHLKVHERKPESEAEGRVVQPLHSI